MSGIIETFNPAGRSGDLRALIETTVRAQAARFGLDVITNDGLVVWGEPDDDALFCGVKPGDGAPYGVACFTAVNLASLGKGGIEEHIANVIERIAESTAALASPLVPDGAVCLELGSRFVKGCAAYEPEARQPVCMVNRSLRVFRRVGDTHLRPWPPIVVFVGKGGVPIVERAA